MRYSHDSHTNHHQTNKSQEDKNSLSADSKLKPEVLFVGTFRVLGSSNLYEMLLILFLSYIFVLLNLDTSLSEDKASATLFPAL